MADLDESVNIDVSKLKVADLKKELKARGLSTTGNKTDLMERLHLSLQGEGSLILEADSVVADSEEILDEDDVLADEEALDDDIADISGKTEDLISDMTVSESKRKLDELEEPAVKLQPAKKIVLNRTIVTMSEKENHEQEASDVRVDASDKKVIKLSTLSVKERLEMRAQKFGVALSADAKKEARAARFGITGSISSGDVSASADVLKKRAERFGTSVSGLMNKVELDERIKKRQERFGIVQPSPTINVISTSKITSTNSSLDEKKRQRAERFKINK